MSRDTRSSRPSVLVRCSLAMALALLPGVCRGTDTNRDVRGGSELDFRPYSFTGQAGQPTGFGVELLQATADKMGLRLRVTPGPWDSQWTKLVAGELDVLPVVARTPGRESLVAFSLPHTETFDAFFVRSGRPPINEIAAATGKEIVVLREDAAHHQLVERKFPGTIIPVDSIPAGLRLVAAGKHDAFLCSKLVGVLECQQAGIRGLVAGPPIPDYKRTFAFAVTKDNPELLEKLNQGLLIVKTDGTYDRIYRRWLAVEDPWRKWLPYFKGAVAGLIALAGLVVVLQWLVHRRTRELARAKESLQALNATLEQRVAGRTAELQESETRLRLIARAARIGFFEWNATKDTAYWSPEHYELFGYEAGSPITWDRWLQGVHPEDRQRLVQNSARLLERDRAEGKVQGHKDEYRFVRPDGSVVWLESDVSVEKVGRETILRGSVRDLTERKKAEEAQGKVNAELQQRIAQEEAANAALREARRAAVNLMKDAVAARGRAEQAEATVLESAERLRSLAENVPCVLMRFDRQFRIVYLSKQSDRYNPNSTERMIGRTNREMGMPEHLCDLWDAAIERVFCAGTQENVQFDFAGPSGMRTFELRFGPEFSPDHEVQYVLGVSSDITERKRADDQLRRLNRTLQAYTDSNRALLRLTGEADYLQEVCRIIVEDCGYAMVWVGFAENDEGKTIRPVAAAGFEEGYLDTLQLTWTDTERGRGPTGTAIRTGQYSACHDMLNDPRFAPWRAEALKRGYASSAVFPLLADGQAFGALTIYSREPGAFTGDEVKLLTELAGDFSFGITTLRLRVAHAAAEDAVRKLNAELEHRVRERTAELDATNRELEAFSYSVSHDLRTPLRSLDGFSQALLEDYGPLLDATGKDYLVRIRSSSQRMGRLIDDLLNLSRLTRAHMRHTTVDLTALAETVVAELRKADPTRTVNVRIAPGLAAKGDPTLLGTVIANLLENAWKFTSRRADAVIEVGAERLPVPADAILPEREGVPLPVPAIATPDATLPEREGVPLPVPAIATPDATLPEREGVPLPVPADAILPEREGVPLPVFTRVFFVRDNGVGFDTHYADKLFMPFQRLHSIDDFPGSGVGLATVQRVIRRHGGRVWFESAPGQGAAFFFTIGSTDECDQNATCGAVLAAVSDSK